MKVIYLFILLTLVGCQKAGRAPATQGGSTYVPPKTPTKNVVPKRPSTPVAETDLYPVPPELAKYVDSFYNRMGNAGLNNYRRKIKIMMDPDLPRKWGGTCTFQYGDQPAVIKISSYWWYNSDYSRRELVMYHELGHCVLNREHSNSLNSFNRARSLMHAQGLPYNDEYEDYYPEYLAELFRVSPSKFATAKFAAYIYYDTNYQNTAASSAYRDDYVTSFPPTSDAPPDVECGSH